MDSYSTITTHVGNDKIHVVTLRREDNTLNRIDEPFVSDFEQTIDALSRSDPKKGVIIQTAGAHFLAGADFNLFLNTTQKTAPKLAHLLNTFKQCLRRLEHLGCPVVACLSGAALGGGWELALACHYRIATSNQVKVGLPEVQFGLLPGAGGITRTTRLFGLEQSLPALCLGTTLNADQALDAGWLHAVANTQEEALEKAQQWIFTHPSPQQLWESPSYVPSAPNAKTIQHWQEKLARQEGGRDPAPLRILETAVKSIQLSFEDSETLETQALVDLALGPVSHNKIHLWFQQQGLKSGEQRPHHPQTEAITTLGVIGAGMMGRGICEAATTSGIEVHLTDINKTTAAAAKITIEQSLKRNQSDCSPAQQQVILDRIHPTTNLNHCQLIIEAVFENLALKSDIIRDIPVQADTQIIASNTSTLPISTLSQASHHPDRFIGLHFFSPVPKMPLVEIIRGEHTSDETVARAWDFVRQLNKTPIVVNDACGFFTTRLFATYTAEGLSMIQDGFDPHDIEHSAFHQGFPVGPLAIIDEVSIPLIQSIHHSINESFAPSTRELLSGHAILEHLIKQGRTGRSSGAGFYTYSPNAKKALCEALKNTFPVTRINPDVSMLSNRLWTIQAIEALHCLEEGVIEHLGAANVGSILGIGFPKWMGGVIQAINSTGLKQFVEITQRFCQTFGKRFQVTSLFRQFADTYEEITSDNIRELWAK